MKDVKKEYFEPIVYFIQCLTKEKRIYAKLIATIAFARVSQKAVHISDMDALGEELYESAIYESLIHLYRVSEYPKKRQELNEEINNYYIWAEILRQFDLKNYNPKVFKLKSLSKRKCI